MPSLVEPLWLLLIPAAAVLQWVLPRLGLWRPLRAACVVLMALALAEPRWVRTVSEMDLWVLADRSESASLSVEPRLQEWLGLLERERRGSDRMITVDFAAEPLRRDAVQSGRLEVPRNATRLGLALDYVLRQMDPTRPTRVLALTDGHSTDSLEGLGNRMRNLGIPMDIRLAAPPQALDMRLSRLSLPEGALIGEHLLMEVQIAGNHDGKGRVEIRRNGRLIASEEVNVSGGVARLRMRDRVTEGGAHRYEARLVPEGEDAYPGNNRAAAWLEVRGGPRLLLVTGYANDPIAEALRGTGMEVVVAGVDRPPHAGMLHQARAVIFHNMPASQLPGGFLQAVDFAVREQGMGLWMLGGPNSFGTGGYFGSALDDLLPVSLELKEEQRKIAIAMAVVMDRSGSMAAGVSGGKTKMDLANEGTARAIELLGSRDELAVFAVDSEAHEVFPLLPVGPNRAKMIELAGGVTSQGGGIFVYTGLKAGWDTISKSVNGTRHIILFSDAADSEEPDAYVSLLQTMRAQNATISVIALGTESDTDADLLKDIADKGGGRIFFTNQPDELPNIFAQETVSVARSAFITDPVGTRILPAALELAGDRLPFPESVPAYNLCYPKPDASLAVLATDEDKAPLLAFWQRGAGRVVALCLPMAGEEAAPLLQWPGYGPLAQTIARWVAAPDLPTGMALRMRREGSTARLDLFYDAALQQSILKQAPRIVTSTGEGDPREQVWERIAPGHYQATLEIATDLALRGAVQAGDVSVPFGPITSTADAEWEMDPAGIAALRAESRGSGGRELVDFSEAWLAPPMESNVPLQAALLVVLVLVVVAEVFWTRWTGAA